MQIFGRVYYAIAALTLAAAACSPWLVPVSYQALGYPLTLMDSGTYEAFSGPSIHALASPPILHRLAMARTYPRRALAYRAYPPHAAPHRSPVAGHGGHYGRFRRPGHDGDGRSYRGHMLLMAHRLEAGHQKIIQAESASRLGLVQALGLKGRAWRSGRKRTMQLSERCTSA